MKRKLIFPIIIGVIICFTVGIVASQITQISVNTWYPTLKKPFFTPPSWLFAPVWTLLYLLMGIALGRVWYFGIQQSHVKKAVYLFGFQLLFNGLWSLVFFGLKNPIGGLVVIVALFFLTIKTVQQFKTIELFASRLLYPYLIWICFASLLNGGIVFLNYL